MTSLFDRMADLSELGPQTLFYNLPETRRITPTRLPTIWWRLDVQRWRDAELMAVVMARNIRRQRFDIEPQEDR